MNSAACVSWEQRARLYSLDMVRVKEKHKKGTRNPGKESWQPRNKWLNFKTPHIFHIPADISPPHPPQREQQASKTKASPLSQWLFINGLAVYLRNPPLQSLIWFLPPSLGRRKISLCRRWGSVILKVQFGRRSRLALQMIPPNWLSEEGGWKSVKWTIFSQRGTLF